jgi:phage host-nuclease inhibitor protein Gam
MKNKTYENVAEEIKKMKTFIKWCERNYDKLTEKEQDLICDFKNDSEDLFNW